MQPLKEVTTQSPTLNVVRDEPKKINIFGAAKEKKKTTSAKADKTIVHVEGIEPKLLDHQRLKAEIDDLEAQLKGITDEIKTLSKEKFIELYKATGANPNTFLIQDGNGCIMVLPMDKYITIKDEARGEQLRNEYGDDAVDVDVRYYFNKSVLERNQVAIQNAIENLPMSDSDKENLLIKESKYSVAKGLIDRLMGYGDRMDNVVTDVQPIFMLKNCGGAKMADGGDFGGELILDIPVKLGYSDCHYAPVYSDADVCSSCGHTCNVLSEEQVRNELGEESNEFEGSEEQEQMHEAREYSKYAKGGTIVYLDGAQHPEKFKTKKALYAFVANQTNTGVKKVEIEYPNRIIPTLDTYEVMDGKLIHKGELMKKNYDRAAAEEKRLATQASMNKMMGYAKGGGVGGGEWTYLVDNNRIMSFNKIIEAIENAGFGNLKRVSDKIKSLNIGEELNLAGLAHKKKLLRLFKTVKKVPAQYAKGGGVDDSFSTMSETRTLAKGGGVKKKWIADALSGKQGALRATAMRLGLLSGKKDTLSKTDLRKLEKTGNKTTAKRAHLAETLGGFKKGVSAKKWGHLKK